MKLAIFGHTYVTHLFFLKIEKFEFDNVTIEIEYFDYPGATFSKFLDDPSLLNGIKDYDPDFVVVILGGCDITLDMKVSETKENCRLFYEKFRITLPTAKIFACQIELRFYPVNNKNNCPTLKRYKTIRNGLNKFMQNLKSKDSMLLIAGEKNLDNSDNYHTDGIHLSIEGNQVLMDLIKNCIQHHYLLLHPKFKQEISV